MSWLFNKSVFILAAIIAVFVGSLVGFPVKDTEAGGGPDNIRFEVTPSIKSATGAWPDTQVFYRAVSSTQVVRGNWSKYTGGSSVATTIGPEGTSTNMVGDPFNMYYPFGTYLSYPDGTRNAFAMAKWFSTIDLCDAPRMMVSVTNPRTASAVAKGVVDNRVGRYKLFVSENGGSWTDLPIGDFYSSRATQVSDIRVSVDGSADSWKQCASLNWNVTTSWTDGATPTPSPTATPSPKPVRFEVSPAQIFAYQGDDWVNVYLHVDSQGGKVSQTWASIKFDPSIMEVVDMDPNTPGVQGSTNCGATGLVGNELRYTQNSNGPINCYATWRVKGKSLGTTSLSFVANLTGAMLQEQKLPVQPIGGQFTVKTAPTPTATPTPQDIGSDDRAGPTW